MVNSATAPQPLSQLTEEDREEILRRARRLARVTGGTLTEISRRIARRIAAIMNRSFNRTASASRSDA